MDQESMVKGNLMDQFQATLDQFGPGGSLRDTWGRHALPEVKTYGNPADQVVSRATRWLRYAAIILPYSPNVLEEDAFWEVHIQYPA
jgi:hypothetical protein